MRELPAMRDLSRPLRHLLTAFLLVISGGFTLGVFFVDHTTHLHPEGIAERYLGTEAMGEDLMTLPPDAELQYEKTPSEMLNVTHTHMISLSLVFLAVGGIFLLASGVPAWLRAFLILEPFASIVITFGGMWLLRYHAPWWSIVIAISGTVMTTCFYAMVGISLWQLLRRD